MKNIIEKTATLLISLLLFWGCTDEFKEINTNPLALNEVPPTNLLANVLRGTADEFGNDKDVFGTFAGYLVKIQYPENLSGFQYSNNSYGNKWYQCYYANTQLNVLLSNVDENAKIAHVSKIWQVYLWQYLVDAWGDVPYFDAFKGKEEKILTPVFDEQKDIYPDLLARLKTIADNLAADTGDGDIGEGDFIYGGDIVKWQKFCNSLRLRIAMRISGVSATLAKSTIEEICGNPAKYPYIDGNSSGCIFWWSGSAPYEEMWYEDEVTRPDNFGIFDILIDHLLEMDDPRIDVIAQPAGDGEFRGYQNGAPTVSPLSSISHIGTKFAGDAKGFTPFFRACESYFIIAEAAMLGWNVGMTAQAAYEKAVTLSMEENGISTEDTEAYLAGKGKWNNTNDRIWEEMWVALFKENHEAWSLYRRTGVPRNNYITIRSVYGTAHNDQPFRAPYRQNEVYYNKENAEAAIKRQGVVDYGWGAQLWWDTREGVY